MLQSIPANIILPELDEPFCCVHALQSNDPSETTKGQHGWQSLQKAVFGTLDERNIRNTRSA
jgi:hypothetical protein